MRLVDELGLDHAAFGQSHPAKSWPHAVSCTNRHDLGAENLLVGHFVFKFRFDDLLGATCGVAANPAHAVFASKLAATDRTDIAYAITFPTGTIMKILLLQVMLAVMG